MARATFTDNIQRHIACPSMEVPGQTVREILERVFVHQTLMRNKRQIARGCVTNTLTPEDLFRGNLVGEYEADVHLLSFQGNWKFQTR